MGCCHCRSPAATAAPSSRECCTGFCGCSRGSCVSYGARQTQRCCCSSRSSSSSGSSRSGSSSRQRQQTATGWSDAARPQHYNRRAGPLGTVDAYRLSGLLYCHCLRTGSDASSTAPHMQLPGLGHPARHGGGLERKFRCLGLRRPGCLQPLPPPPQGWLPSARTSGLLSRRQSRGTGTERPPGSAPPHWRWTPRGPAARQRAAGWLRCSSPRQWLRHGCG